MLEYTFAKAILLLLICRCYTLDYPCIKPNCGITEICYPVALNCRDGNCSFRNRCLERNKLKSHCPYGNALLKDDETLYHCTGDQQCPGQTFCHVNSDANNRVCCWKQDEVQNNQQTQIQNNRQSQIQNNLQSQNQNNRQSQNQNNARSQVQNNRQTQIQNNRQSQNQNNRQDTASRETIHLACPLPNLFANCDKDCKVDTDCGDDQRCCFNGCGRLCVTIDSKQFQNRKAGVCPVDKPSIFICSMRLRCYTDNDCIGNFLCCHISGCGSICRPPARVNTRNNLTNAPPQRSSSNQNNSFRRNNQLQRNPTNTARNLQNFNPQRKSTEPQRDTLQNTPSPNFNTDQTRSFQFGINRCAWFQVLYGGC